MANDWTYWDEDPEQEDKTQSENEQSGKKEGRNNTQASNKLGEAPEFPPIFFAYDSTTKKLEVKDCRGNVITGFDVMTVNGKDGKDGDSAFQLWKKGQKPGTDVSFEAFLNAFKGAKGEKGIQGPTGPQGEKGDIWMPIVSTDGESLYFRNSKGEETNRYPIKGVKGDQGIQGVQGPIGPKGDKGEAWIPIVTNDGCFLYFRNADGEETERFPIKGVKGDQGLQGVQGPIGPKGDKGEAWIPIVTNDGCFLYFRNADGEETERFPIKGVKGDQGIQGPRGLQGETGPVYTPRINSDGTLSWTNNGENLPNPTPINIKGERGEKGEEGVTYQPIVKDGVIYWTNNQGKDNPDPVRIAGPQGDRGDAGRSGLSAYQIWLKAGNLGTEQDFLDSLKGEKGEPFDPSKIVEFKVEDYTCPIQEINTRLIVDKNESCEDADTIIDKRIDKIDQLRRDGKQKTKGLKKKMFYWINPVNFLKEFTWMCAGADRYLLRMCPSDHSKYVGIGTVILFTALMAWFSSFIAMQLVFEIEVPKDADFWTSVKLNWPAIAFATFWAAMIFCLDRFITTTMYSDGKVSISKQEFFSGLPRIVIAIFLGIIISAPLELEIFKEAITEEMDQEQRLAGLEEKNRIRDLISGEYTQIQTQYKAQIDENKGTIQTLQSTVEQMNAQRKALYDESSYTDTLGKLHSYQTRDSKEAQKKWDKDNKHRLDTLNSQILRLTTKNVELSQSLSSDFSTLRSNEAGYKEDVDSAKLDRGLLVRLQTLHDLAMKDYEPWGGVVERIWLVPQDELPHKKDIEGKDKIDEDALIKGTHYIYENKDGLIDYITLHRLWHYLLFSPIGLIMLLFILIDISPVLYKMMLADGKYDNYMHQDKLLAQDKIRLSLAKMLKHLNDSELKRVAPFVMGDIYEKMAGDSFIYKTEEEYQNEHLAQKPIHWAWRIWPLSMLRWMFWKEEGKPSAPVIVMEDKRVSKNEETLHEVNDKVFKEVLDMKRRLILASYRRWYKTQYYQLDPNGDDGIVPPPDNFPEGDGGYDGANGYGPNNENIPPSGGGTSTKEEDEEINIDGSYMDSEKERDHSSYEHEINDDETTEEKDSSFDNSKYEREVEEDDEEKRLN